MAQDAQLAGLGTRRLRIALPEPSISYEQDSEWCLVEHADGWREIRFHDYAEIYSIEGLYEQLFYDILKCNSPRTVCSLLKAELTRAGANPGELRVLDLGAGNGLMGEELVGAGVASVVGVDIIPEAREAALRDRPGVYADFHILDMTALSEQQRAELRGHRFTALTCVAALGFDDIPPAAFRGAFNVVDDGGWVAFTIKDSFLSDQDSSGFAGLIKNAISDGRLEIRSSQHYQHRLATTGEPLHYQAIIGRKVADLPD
ncbi:class I SAM-dependent DNA methyltransferase [Pseudonocardia sp. H11422]|uniref:class I SAM-dependent DNA methyltransferase n=1 Tax=Pseudonocardia sp. H11422 TaxID=2835866 RepID=UPI001BDD8651|nr:class I SAM-dependent methyltransferase [Pseudonocardia sp. H11422]